MKRKFEPVRLITWLTAFLLVLTIATQLPLSSLLSTLRKLSAQQWVIWMSINLLNILILVARWRVLASSLGLNISFTSLLLVRQAGQLISFVTPGPQFGGEPIQIYWLWKNYRLPGHSALLVVGLDRFFELWINFAVLLFAVTLLMLTTATDRNTWQIVAGVLTVIILILSAIGWFLVSHSDRLTQLFQRIASRWQQHPVLGKLDSKWSELGNMLTQLTTQHKPELLLALILSLIAWVGMLGEIWLMLTFFDSTPEFTGFIALFVAIRLAFLMPLPGGVGTLEAAVYWACKGLQLPATVALGLIVLMRIRDALFLTGGFFALRYLNLGKQS